MAKPWHTACPWFRGQSTVPTSTAAALCFLCYLSLHIPCYHWDKWMPDSGNQLWPRLFCLPNGDRGPEQTSPISRVSHQAAGHSVFMFADSTLQQLSLWLKANKYESKRKADKRTEEHLMFWRQSLSTTVFTTLRRFKWAPKAVHSDGICPILERCIAS